MVKSSTPQGTESAQEWQVRLQKILEQQGVSEFLKVKVQETTHTEKHYLRRGRPTANTPYRWETYSQLSYQQWFGQFSGGDRINYSVITKSFILQAIFFQGLAFG